MKSLGLERTWNCQVHLFACAKCVWQGCFQVWWDRFFVRYGTLETLARQRPDQSDHRHDSQHLSTHCKRFVGNFEMLAHIEPQLFENLSRGLFCKNSEQWAFFPNHTWPSFSLWHVKVQTYFQTYWPTGTILNHSNSNYFSPSICTSICST